MRMILHVSLGPAPSLLTIIAQSGRGTCLCVFEFADQKRGVCVTKLGYACDQLLETKWLRWGRYTPNQTQQIALEAMQLADAYRSGYRCTDAAVCGYQENMHSVVHLDRSVFVDCRRRFHL